MPFKKGDKKIAGRKKGTPNKKQKMAPIRIQFMDTIYPWNTADELISFYQKAQDEKVKFQIIELIVRYTNIIPTTEIQYEDEETIDASVDDLMKVATT